MGELLFIGLGLFDEQDISMRGIQHVKDSDYVFAEFYTNFLSGFSLNNFKKISNIKKISIVSRKNLEEEEGKIIINKAKKYKVSFLVPGDPLIATTHIDLRIRAEKLGIKTKVIHCSSIISAVPSISGLQNYRFGKSVSIPLLDSNKVYSPYEVILENKLRGLHTLCFLDFDIEKNKFLTIKKALEYLLNIERNEKKKVIHENSIAIGISRVGSDRGIVKSDIIKKLLNFKFGNPPHTLVIPADYLHFMEAEALIYICDAPKNIREMVK